MSSAKSSGTRSRKATDKEKIKIPQVPFTFNTKDINVGDDRASLASSPSTVATTRLATYSGRKDEDHIPRPKNAFILFRGSCWKVEKERVDKPGTSSNFSKIAAQVWKSMSAEQQDPWRRLAEEEKHLHNLHYPGYKYTPQRRQPTQPRRPRSKSLLCPTPVAPSTRRRGPAKSMAGLDAEDSTLSDPDYVPGCGSRAKRGSRAGGRPTQPRRHSRKAPQEPQDATAPSEPPSKRARMSQELSPCEAENAVEVSALGVQHSPAHTQWALLPQSASHPSAELVPPSPMSSPSHEEVAELVSSASTGPCIRVKEEVELDLPALFRESSFCQSEAVELTTSQEATQTLSLADLLFGVPHYPQPHYGHGDTSLDVARPAIPISDYAHSSVANHHLSQIANEVTAAGLMDNPGVAGPSFFPAFPPLYAHDLGFSDNCANFVDSVFAQDADAGACIDETMSDSYSCPVVSNYSFLEPADDSGAVEGLY